MSYSGLQAWAGTRRDTQTMVIPLPSTATPGQRIPEAPNSMIEKDRPVCERLRTALAKLAVGGATAAFCRLAAGAHTPAEHDLYCCRVNKRQKENVMFAKSHPVRIVIISVFLLLLAGCGNHSVRNDLSIINVSSAMVTEGNDGTTNLVFPADLTPPSSKEIHVDDTTSDGTAKANEDYRPVTDRITIPANSKSTTISIAVSGDTDVESDEIINLTLTNPVNAKLGTARATGTIHNDDTPSPGSPKPCIPSGKGTYYPVGPGQKHSSLSQIPWSSLKPGDTVRIFWRNTPYREKILISTRGTRQQPIRICGVAGSNGKRPTISGQNATTRPRLGNLDNYFSNDHDNFQGLGLIILSGNYDEKPANIIIDGLHLKRAHKEYSFTNTRGEKRNYRDGAACIRLQAADNVVIRNNEIEQCGNGIFTMSQEYNEASLTRNILIEGNYLHDNGQSGSGRQHNLYIQAIGAVYQYNRFGPNIPGSIGTNLKDRSAGTVIRYNWFEGGSRTVDLVEVEDSAPWFVEKAYLNSLEGSAPDPDRLADVRATEARYRKTYVYGNQFLNIGSEAGSNLIHYGYDNDPELARKGTLYSYNNTLMIRHDRDDQWRVRIFDVSLYNESKGTPGEETIEAFNNIIYLVSETPKATPSYLCIGRESGTINLGVNWITSSWNSADTFSECYPYDTKPVFNGAQNLVDTAKAAAPIDIKTLAPNDIPTIRNHSQPLPGAVNNSHPVKYQYVRHQTPELRPSTNNLGAVELP